MSDPAMISAVQRLSSSGYFTLAAVHMSRPNATARAILIPVSWPTHLRFSLPSLPFYLPLSQPVPHLEIKLDSGTVLPTPHGEETAIRVRALLGVAADATRTVSR